MREMGTQILMVVHAAAVCDWGRRGSFAALLPAPCAALVGLRSGPAAKRPNTVRSQSLHASPHATAEAPWGGRRQSTRGEGAGWACVSVRATVRSS